MNKTRPKIYNDIQIDTVLYLISPQMTYKISDKRFTLMNNPSQTEACSEFTHNCCNRAKTKFLRNAS